jgi:chromate reductase
MAIEIYPIDDIPFYNGDVEEAGVPVSVSALHETVGDADGVIYFTPEYNGSFPAVTKNLMDWLSRPPRSLDGTPVTAVATTPGGRAGAGVLSHFTSIYERMAGEFFFEPLGIGSYGDKLDEAGELTDPETVAELGAYLSLFAEFIVSH